MHGKIKKDIINSDSISNQFRPNMDKHFNNAVNDLESSRVSNGTELKNIIIGSEGNIGIIVSAIVKIHEISKVID